MNTLKIINIISHERNAICLACIRLSIYLAFVRVVIGDLTHSGTHPLVIEVLGRLGSVV